MLGRTVLLLVAFGACGGALPATYSFVVAPRIEEPLVVPVSPETAVPLPSYESDADTIRLPPAHSAEWMRERERDAGLPVDLANLLKRGASGR